MAVGLGSPYHESCCMLSLAVTCLVSFTWVKMACGFWIRLVAQTSMSILRTAFLEILEMSITGDQGRLWCAEMMKCLSDAVPDYVEKMRSNFPTVRVRSLLLLNFVQMNAWTQSLFWVSAVLCELRHLIKLVVLLIMHGCLNATRETLEELGLVGYQIDTFSSDYADHIQ